MILRGRFEQDNITQCEKGAELSKGLGDSNNKLLFQGQFINNKPKKGKYIYPEGDIYEGDLNETGERHGNGKYTYKSSGDIYEGSWRENLKNGTGSFKGEKYEWKDDKLIKKLEIQNIV